MDISLPVASCTGFVVRSVCVAYSYVSLSVKVKLSKPFNSFSFHSKGKVLKKSSVVYGKQNKIK